ncbi:MAG TPA: hypothetical protein VIP70_08685 [Nitrososphaeraceae archaeon]|jgi:hypothetical protein
MGNIHRSYKTPNILLENVIQAYDQIDAFINELKKQNAKDQR